MELLLYASWIWINQGCWVKINSYLLQVCHWEETLSWVWIKGWTGGVVYRVFSSCSARRNSQQALQPQPQLVTRFQAFQESFTAGGGLEASPVFPQVDGVCKVAPVVALLAGDPSASAEILGQFGVSNQDSKFWVTKDCCILKFIQTSLNHNWFLH